MLAGLFAAALLLVAACGDDSSESKTTGPAEIDQTGLKFVPQSLTVKVGDTVTIKNSEEAIHTANINGKNVSGNMKKGSVVTWKAEAAGEYKVTCDYHPDMKATITVTQ